MSCWTNCGAFTRNAVRAVTRPRSSRDSIGSTSIRRTAACSSARRWPNPAGGTQKCGQAVYASDDDPDYQAVRTLVEDALGRAWANPRRDLQALIRSPQTASVTERAGKVNERNGP